MQATGYDLFVKLDFQQRVWCRLRGSVTSYDVAAAAGVPGGSSSTMGSDAGDTRWELGTVAFCEMYRSEPLVHVQLLGEKQVNGRKDLYFMSARPQHGYEHLNKKNSQKHAETVHLALRCNYPHSENAQASLWQQVNGRKDSG